MWNFLVCEGYKIGWWWTWFSRLQESQASAVVLAHCPVWLAPMLGFRAKPTQVSALQFIPPWNTWPSQLFSSILLLGILGLWFKYSFLITFLLKVQRNPSCRFVAEFQPLFLSTVWRSRTSQPSPHRPFPSSFSFHPRVSLVVRWLFFIPVWSVWISQCLTESIREKKAIFFVCFFSLSAKG